MAPKTPKGAKRAEKDTLENDATAKVAKELPEQTPGASAVEQAPDQASKEAAKATPLESAPVNAPAGEDQDKAAPAKEAHGDPIKEAAVKHAETNGTTEAEKPGKEATAAGIEAGKTQKVEEPAAEAPKSEDTEKKVAEPAIGEAKPVTEAE